MWKKLIAGLLCTAFISHFAITLIYNTPSNPIKAKYNKQLSAYMDPIFTQNWRLFAPAPVTTNSKFFVKAKIKSDND
ncbi:DNA-directed RNA polymerase subunit beta, partial [Bacillus toyonensis]